MAKNKMIVLLFSMYVCSSMLFAQNHKRSATAQKVNYVEKDSMQNSAWAEPYIPPGICVVKDAKSAAIVASVYVANIYGRKISKIEQPYSVSALNDSLWIVRGAPKRRSKHKPWRGIFIIVVEKKTGKIISCMHEK